MNVLIKLKLKIRSCRIFQGNLVMNTLLRDISLQIKHFFPIISIHFRYFELQRLLCVYIKINVPIQFLTIDLTHHFVFIKNL